jgi:HEAT repeat protein
MEVTIEQVKSALEPEEPDYDEAAKLGAAALPHLQRLVESGDPNLGSKAAYLAGRIGDTNALPVLEAAAASSNPGIRAAAAGGARHLPGNVADAILILLVDDESTGVRKTALRSVPEIPSLELAEKLNARRTLEQEPAIRDLADDVFDRVSRVNREAEPEPLIAPSDSEGGNNVG